MKYKIALLLFAIIAIGAVGSGDMQDEIAEEQFYTEMVCDGHWPDYKNLEPECHVD